MGIVANATGLKPDRASMHAPVARTIELPELFCRREEGGLFAADGTVDIFNCFRRADEASFAGGVFVVVDIHDDATFEVLKGKCIPASRKGSRLLLYNPTHLLGVEAPITILSAALCGHSSVGADFRPRCDFVARAARDLAVGTVLAIGDQHTHSVPHLEPHLVDAAPIGDGPPAALLHGDRQPPLARGQGRRVPHRRHGRAAARLDAVAAASRAGRGVLPGAMSDAGEAVYGLPVVDAHHHLWDLKRGRYPWLQEDYDPQSFFLGDYAALRHDFLPDDYRATSRGCNVIATVHVEAERDRSEQVAETVWLHEMNARYGMPNAVVGHAWLDRPETEERLLEHLRYPLVRGIRSKPVTSRNPGESVRGKPGTMQDEKWLRGLALLGKHGLSWDLRVPAWHLPEAAEVAAMFPTLPIVLNHHGFAWDRSEEGLEALARLAGDHRAPAKRARQGIGVRRSRPRLGLGRGHPHHPRHRRGLRLAALDVRQQLPGVGPADRLPRPRDRRRTRARRAHAGAAARGDVRQRAEVLPDRSGLKPPPAQSGVFSIASTRVAPNLAT